MQIIERYLAEELGPREAEAFEAHYFQCERCFEELKLRDAAARELLSTAVEPASEVTSSSRLRGNWKWALAAAALLVVLLLPLSLLVIEHAGPEVPGEQAGSRAGESLPAALTEIREMPAYLGATLRGEGLSESRRAFLAGMEEYRRGDYSNAVSWLEEAVALDPENTPSAFYLGVSYLAADQPQPAAVQLSRVAAASADAYEEEALWYLAKAQFRLGQIEEGRVHLARIVSLGGVFEEEARSNLQLLESLEE